MQRAASHVTNFASWIPYGLFREFDNAFSEAGMSCGIVAQPIKDRGAYCDVVIFAKQLDFSYVTSLHVEFRQHERQPPTYASNRFIESPCEKLLDCGGCFASLQQVVERVKPFDNVIFASIRDER